MVGETRLAKRRTRPRPTDGVTNPGLIERGAHRWTTRAPAQCQGALKASFAPDVGNSFAGRRRVAQGHGVYRVPSAPSALQAKVYPDADAKPDSDRWQPAGAPGYLAGELAGAGVADEEAAGGGAVGGGAAGFACGDAAGVDAAVVVTIPRSEFTVATGIPRLAAISEGLWPSEFS